MYPAQAVCDKLRPNRADFGPNLPNIIQHRRSLVDFRRVGIAHPWESCSSMLCDASQRASNNGGEQLACHSRLVFWYPVASSLKVVPPVSVLFMVGNLWR